MVSPCCGGVGFLVLFTIISPVLTAGIGLARGGGVERGYFFEPAFHHHRDREGEFGERDVACPDVEEFRKELYDLLADTVLVDTGFEVALSCVDSCFEVERF